MNKDDRIMIALYIAMIVFVFFLPIFSAHQEAAAYNRIANGPHVTTWDALWLELRVEACNGPR
jgi:hypothetical protein